MRKAYEDKLLEIIKAIVIDGKREHECQFLISELEQEQLNALALCAKRHQITHFVYYVMGYSGHTESERDFLSSVAVTVQQSKAAFDISAAFSKHKIPHIMLKGTVIRKLYPEAWMRNGCDIDVLVKNEDLQRAGDVLKDIGYEFESMITHHASYHNDYIEVELHYLLIEDFLNIKASRVLDNVWDIALKLEAKNENSFLYELPDEYMYFYQLAHMVRHFNRGECGIRPVLDIWMLNNCCDNNRQKREKILEEGGLTLFEKHMVELGDFWFSNGSGEGLEKIEQWVLSAGTVSPKERVESIMKTQHNNRFQYFLYVMFPPYNKMCHRYRILKKHKWLLPLFYILRYFHLLYLMGIKRIVSRLKTLFTKEKRQSEIKSMLNQLGILDVSKG